MDTNTGTPTLLPPTVIAGGGGAAGSTVPTIADAAAAGAALTAPGGPTQPPPATISGATAEAGAGAITGTWRNGVTVDALWAVNETRNAFMRVAGVGWRKLYNGRDGAFTALVALASQARQTGRTINFREEADGMVYEIYLW